MAKALITLPLVHRLKNDSSVVPITSTESLGKHTQPTLPVNAGPMLTDCLRLQSRWAG